MDLNLSKNLRLFPTLIDVNKKLVLRTYLHGNKTAILWKICLAIYLEVLASFMLVFCLFLQRLACYSLPDTCEMRWFQTDAR